MTERDYLKKYDIKILIISRSRWRSINDRTLRIMPDWIEVLVPESEKEKYEKEIKNPVIAIPDEMEGLGKTRNWVLDNFEENTIVMIDDDIIRVYSLTGAVAKRVEQEELIQVIINTAVMAQDLGVSVFGFSQTDIRKYKGTDPFILNTWVGCCVGVIGRKYRFRDDKFKVDIDFCLQNLLSERITFTNNMYYFVQSRDNNRGGNSLYRTEENMKESTYSLAEKWSPYVRINENKRGSQIKIQLNVPRRQMIEYD